MIVINTTVLSNLARTKQVWLLKELFEEIIVPMPVFEEIVRGIRSGYDFLKPVSELVEKEDWTLLESLKNENEKRLFIELLDNLGSGEAAGIAIARERKLLFLSDDKVARKVAKNKGVEVSGTLGMLKVGVKKRKISVEEANKVLQKMIEKGYHSPICSMNELLEKENG